MNPFHNYVHTLTSVQLPLAQAEAEFDHIIEPLAFYQNVSPSKELRDASNNAESAVREYGVDASMRIDVFRAKQAAAKNIKDSGRKLTPEEQRLVDKMIQDGTRAGLALPEKERTELMALKKELSNSCLEFSVSIAVSLQILYIAQTCISEKLQRGKRKVHHCYISKVLTGCLGYNFVHFGRTRGRATGRDWRLHQAY